MGKKIFAVVSIVLGVAIMYVSTSRIIMQKISLARNSAPWMAWWGVHDVEEMGDLARMAYLDRVDKFRDTIKDIYPAAEKGKKSIDLYVWGDSYTMHIPGSSFYGINAYNFGRRDYYDLIYDLDTTKTNILIIAFGERFVYSNFYYYPTMLDHVKKAPESTTAAWRFRSPLRINIAAAFPAIPVDSLFNPNINQNLEYNIFTYNFLTRIRNLKAELNYKLFNRASGDVVVSRDGDYLFLKETVEPGGVASSYLRLSEDEISTLLSKINIAYDNYKNDGFDEIYLSVIPNTVSVVQPFGYGELVPILNDPNRRGYQSKMPIIDLYSTYIKDPHRYFKHGDTHWNRFGAQVWLDKVNDILRKWESGELQPQEVTDRIY